MRNIYKRHTSTFADCSISAWLGEQLFLMWKKIFVFSIWCNGCSVLQQVVALEEFCPDMPEMMSIVYATLTIYRAYAYEMNYS